MTSDSEPVITLVDSNVLLDIVTDDPAWSGWSSQALEQVLDKGEAVLNPLVYAEVSVGFDRIEDLDKVLPATAFRRESRRYRTYFPRVALLSPPEG